MTRAQINAAEERAIWASPKGTTPSSAPTVTMTGCIEKRGDSVRLTDTEGDDAPRSRRTTAREHAPRWPDQKTFPRLRCWRKLVLPRCCACCSGRRKKR